MNFITICAVCIFTVVTVTLFKQYSPAYAVVLSIVASAILLLICVLFLKPIIEELSGKISSIDKFSSFFASILKCVAITYLLDFSTKLCEENGNKTLTVAVTIFGKTSLIYICLPYIDDTLKLIERLVNI